MRAVQFCAVFLLVLSFFHSKAKAQPKRGVAQVSGAVTQPPPPPPGPPPDFIDDDTEFDDGDDLPDDFPPPAPQQNFNPSVSNGQPPFPQQQYQPPQPQVNQNNNRALPQPPPPPVSQPMPSYETDRPRFTTGKIHFRVVKDEFYEKGKKRERGQMDRQ
jgi:hypothetical protein